MDTTRKDPMKAFRFQVELENKGGVVAAFSQFSGIKMDVDTIQVRAGNDNRGVQEYVPVLTRFAPVTLTKGVIGNNQFLDWLFSVAAGVETGSSDKNLRRTINIIALNEQGEPGVTWSLKNAIPIGYELMPLDGGKSEMASESLTFAITGLSREVHTDKK